MIAEIPVGPVEAVGQDLHVKRPPLPVRLGRGPVTQQITQHLLPVYPERRLSVLQHLPGRLGRRRAAPPAVAIPIPSSASEHRVGTGASDAAAVNARSHCSY